MNKRLLLLALAFGVWAPAAMIRPESARFQPLKPATNTADLAAQRGLGASDFGLIQWSDPQYLAQNWSDAYLTYATWCRQQTNRAALTLILGDIVNDGGNLTQWATAQRALQVLSNSTMPHLLAPGNHDSGAGGRRDLVNYNACFGPNYYTNQPWWSGGFYESGHAENLYFLQTNGSLKMLYVILEYCPRQAAANWASNVMVIFSNHLAVLGTHSWLNTNGMFTANGNPAAFEGGYDGNNPDVLWTNTFSRLPNLRWILNGHTIRSDGGGVAFNTTLIGSNGNPVACTLFNWQGELNSNTNLMFVRQYTVHGAQGWVEARTYNAAYPGLNRLAPAQSNGFFFTFPLVAEAEAGLARFRVK